MSTIKADEALAQFRKSFDDAGLQYEVVDSSSDVVKLKLVCRDITLSVWFDASVQQWGFDLLQGGHKSCDTFSAFEDYLGTYLNINTVLIPEAKLVADAFEREAGITTVYDSFSGNKQSGYTVKFRVLSGEDQDVLVKHIPEGYLVRLVSIDSDSGKYKVKAEFKYELGDDGAVTSIPTIHMIMKQFSDKYADKDNVNFQRVGEDIFSMMLEGLNITVQVQFNYLEVRYHVTEVGCYDADFVVAPDDPYDFNMIYMRCKDFYDDCVAGDDAEESPMADLAKKVEERVEHMHEIAQASKEEAERNPLGAPVVQPNKYDDGEGAVSYDGDSSNNSVESKSVLSGLDVTTNGVVSAEESSVDIDSCIGTGVELTSTAVAVNVESVKVVLDDGVRTGVQFIVNGCPQIFNIDDVEAVGIPVRRIKETVNVINKCGIRMTEDELRLKKYSEELDNPQEMLSRIADAIFA